MEKPKVVSLKTVLKAVVSISERMADFATKNDLEKLATKEDVEKLEERILKEIRPIARAVDADALTLVSHEKRITKIERHLAIK